MSAVLLLALAAVAATPAVAVTGDCPSAAAVTAALGSALGGDQHAAADLPRVADLGDRFQVAAAGQVQQYTDPARNCDERARAAAVFIALALNPPLVPPAPPPAILATPAPPPVPTARWLDLGVAARVDGGSSLTAGAEMRASAGGRWLGVTATAGVLAPTEGTFSSVNVRQQRFPLSLTVTARRPLSDRLVLAGAVGAALVPLTLSGEGIPDARSTTRLDAGFRLAAELMFRATPRFRPFVDLHAELFPRPYELVVDPLGNVGTTGRLWLGAAVGVAFEATPP